jgi:hypothetical protein
MYNYTSAPPSPPPPLPEGGGGILFYLCPSVRPSKIFFVTSIIYVYHIVGSVFGPIRFLLPVCRFCWFLYTFNIHLYMHIFHRIFLSNCWWQESDIWSQASYRYAILWEAFLDLSDSYFLLADLVGFYTHWSYVHIFHHVFLSNYWWQRSDIWSQASYRYPILWEAFLDPSDSCFLFADFVDFYTYWTYILYMPIFRRIFLSNYWWQKSDIWSQALYRYPYRGKRFLTRQIPTSCLPKSRGIISEHQLTVHLVYVILAIEFVMVNMLTRI